MPQPRHADSNAGYRTELEAYYRQSVLDGETFRCAQAAACTESCANRGAFYEGQLSYVGDSYALSVNDRPLRLMIVGQEYGHPPAHVDMAGRTEMIKSSERARFQGGGSAVRNPHMRGTTMILRQLLTGRVGQDKEGEYLAPGHLFDCFALVNFLMCTALDAPRDAGTVGGGKGKSTRTMQRNCGTHFLKTVEILRPTLIFVQGKGVASWIERALGMNVPRDCLAPVTLGGRSVHMGAFNHPSAGGKSGYWGTSVKTRYFQTIVKPALDAYRRDALGLSAGLA